MAGSWVGGASGTTSATIPTHQVGDLIIARAFRDGNNTAPTIPAGQNWTTINNAAGANSNGAAIAYKIATSTSEATGTWTSATRLDVGVWRGFSGIGGSAVDGAASSTVNYPTLTMSVGTGTSWVAGFAAHRSVNTTLETPPTGMTNRLTAVTATDEGAIHDTNGGVSSWTGTTVSVGGTSSGWRGHTVELVLAAGAYSITADQGSFSLTGQAAGLQASRKLVAAQGSFSLSGQAALFSAGRKLIADYGAFTLAGQSAGLVIARKLAAAQGSFALSGQDASLTYTPDVGAYTLTAEAGLFALSGQAATLTYTPVVPETTEDTHDGFTPAEAKAVREYLKKRTQREKPAPAAKETAAQLEHTSPQTTAPEQPAAPLVAPQSAPSEADTARLAILAEIERLNTALSDLALRQIEEARQALEDSMRAREAALGTALILIQDHERDEDDEDDLLLLMSI